MSAHFLMYPLIITDGGVFMDSRWRGPKFKPIGFPREDGFKPIGIPTSDTFTGCCTDPISPFVTLEVGQELTFGPFDLGPAKARDEFIGGTSRFAAAQDEGWED